MNFIKSVLEKIKIIVMWMLIASGSLLLVFEAYNLTELYRKTDLFDLRKIIVKNEFMLTEAEVISISGIKRGVRLMDIDKKRIIKNLNSSPYVRASKIDLIYPSTAVIEISENKPLAYLNTDKGLKFIDRNGTVMGKVRPAGSYDLPVISENTGDKAAVKFLSKALELSPFVYHQVSEIELTQSGIELYLSKSSARVIIGTSDYEKKIVLLENFLKEEYDNLNFENIDYIDFRFEKQVVLKEISSAQNIKERF